MFCACFDCFGYMHSCIHNLMCQPYVSCIICVYMCLSQQFWYVFELFFCVCFCVSLEGICRQICSCMYLANLLSCVDQSHFIL